ncbi:Bg selectin 1 [Biomphalaria pfeifferi]|uniref:Bg selectin 1 n=1 Tax=Biomphalaria pfeifferi TaxID=112525 RepID=A0AAD8BJH5_BIOPF|nr:Bg selectin 1 [Biomphalaria pfeifferi]
MCAMQSWVVISIIAGITLTSAAEDLTFNENLLFLDDNITLTVNPPYIINGLASIVDVRCLFKRDQVPAMATVLSLVIAHSNATEQPVYSLVASVNEFEGHAHNISHDIDVISGSVDNLGESSLHIRFRYPESKLTGLYVCEVQGFDQIGRPITKYTKLKVLPKDAQEIFNKIHKLETDLQKAYTNNTDLQSCQNSNAMLFDTLIQRLSKTSEYNFIDSAFFNGHRYYLSNRKSHFEFNEAQNVCNTIEGYLIELDTPEEMAFFQSFLKPRTDYLLIWTGARRQSDGFWRYNHSGSITPSFTWRPGDPVQNDHYNCQCSGSDIAWKTFAICVCDDNEDNLGYICEVPVHNC